MNRNFPSFCSTGKKHHATRHAVGTACHAGWLAACRIAVAAIMVSASAGALPQAHQREFGPYVLRSSTVSSQNIPEETARAHGIERGPQHAIINVTVLNKGAGVDKTVPAKVQVNAHSLTGRPRQIDMRETRAEGYVSYMGTYQIVAGEVLDFTVSAQPEGSSETLTLTYRDRMWGSK